MENQDNPSPNPHNYNTNYNNYVNHNNNYTNNVNPISSSQHPSNNPSPTTPAPQFTTLFWNSDDSASPSVFKGLYHRRAYSDGSFQSAGGDDDGVYTPGLEEMGAEEDELVSAFLNEDNGAGGQLMDHDDGSSGGGETKKKGSRGIRRPSLPAELVELWDEDPKRVKRILANRRSAARSKERKVRYMLELERRIQSLQTDSWNLSAQISIYERETRGLSTENVELKLRLQAMEDQADLRDAINVALRNEVESLKIANAELRTPTEPCPFGAPGRVPYSPSASPSIITPQPPVHFSPLTSPSTLQSPAHSTQPLTSPSTVQLPVHITPPLTSPSTVNLPVHYSPLTSPSNVQTIHFSPLTSPSLVQTVPFTQIASPSAPQTTTTIPRPSVYAVAPLPPLHKSRSSIISRRLRQANLVTPTEQNDSPGSNSKGPDVLNGEGALVLSSRSGSATP
ncbi:hypothetical protein RHSIM_Rhsim01G0242900 [Rhododendron simsii]|uniref:BZIP domain-containing protein n=1 Tax=Rhododendron simsii TaxID=118357 RepID=A0A834HJF0_RHOSS|nr:hypothetical protein RHSIM_Rhsim01G0242900 [Rhododendron simsii]